MHRLWDFFVFVKDLPGRFLAFVLEVIDVQLRKWCNCKLLGTSQENILDTFLR